MSDDLNWHVEEACFNAWPSPREVLHGGWLMRFSGGSIRRTNSVNPLRGPRAEPAGVIEAAEKLYTSLSRDSIFRVPTIAAEMEALLVERGYDFEGGSTVLHCDLRSRKPAKNAAAELSREMTPGWSRECKRIAEWSDADHSVFTDMVASIVVPKAFTSITVDGKIVAKAYGAISNGLLVLESVATDPDYRKRGYGQRAVGTLLDWAKEEGAVAACLQVITDNVPARALYVSLGFTRELHSYHYRRKPY
ncbi:GNAT family N-acetyltransferase [Phyllobacterium myrsinacearum]|uniref:Ribosomal protein S18 acetylase RimI-like enzyme n=1 Tax=Phyllobacterium myrsinacearum TaxID=28101 RepID=A0A839ES93_9HYPH|nr:GNAT family N-acetyltransferase [Phyllobacterium myrsinacearum]MBA8880246.1 ribosomal protein S18 acetylase RimI-like enzyme [Phyllobacterium myrsinacearum]